MKNLVFDFGRVLVAWEPAQIVKNFTQDKHLQSALLEQLFAHTDWLKLDAGILSEQAIINQAAKRLALPQAEMATFFTCIKQSLVPIPQTVELLQWSKQAGFALYGLSNICEEFYTDLYNRYAFFALLDGVVISATEKLAKPDPDIYTLLTKRFNLKAHETLFIDDREENTHAAAALGIKTVTFDQRVETYQYIRTLLSRHTDYQQ